MKLGALALAAAAATGAASAQTSAVGSVQLYGQMTAAVTYKTNQRPGAHSTEVSNSPLAVSLFGLRGSEDLGGGLSTIYTLESLISSDTGSAGGTVGSATKFWNRQSFVGLNLGRTATVTLGRQFHVHTERVIYTLDVYNVAGSNLAITPLALFGVNRFNGNDSRADDSVKLRLNGPAGLTGGVSVALDEGAGRSASLDLAQFTAAYGVGAYWVRFAAPTIAANGIRPEHESWGLGGNTAIGPVRLYAHYSNGRLDSSAIGGVAQKNRIVHLGAAWTLEAPMVLKAGWYHDVGKAMNGVNGRDGNKDTLVLSAEYFLSKRTAVHVVAVSNRYTGGYKLDPINIAGLGRDPNASGTNSFSLGFRHHF